MGYDDARRARLMSIGITVTVSRSSSDRTLTFSESPVRIGRNQLNDVAIDDPFVSEWHGIIRFGEEGIAYADIGSTNGSVLDGVRLVKNVPSRLTESSRILLGRIEIAVSRHLHSTAPHATVSWGVPPKDHSSSANKSSPVAIEPRAPVASARPARAAMEEKRRPAPDPQLLRERQILAAFGEAFVGLRKGYEQFGAEVGVRTMSGGTPLHRARSSEAVLEYLLAPDADPSAVTHDLIAVFADFGIHHIAMMAAVTEGVRALLQTLDPRTNDLDVGARLFSAAKSKKQWQSYIDRFDQILTDDDELHAVIFGPEFARAYARATLRDSNSSGATGRDGQSAAKGQPKKSR
jgi:predicted component of type VI protein secretion system